MSLNLSLSPCQQQRGPSDWDLIGNQIWLCILFARAGFDTSLELYDEVRSERLTADKIFVQSTPEVWTLRQDSIPGLVEIKAIGISGDTLFLETSPIDTLKMAETIELRGYTVKFHARRRCLMGLQGRVLAKLSQDAPATEELTARVLWTIAWRTFTEAALPDAITVLDGLISQDIWHDPDLEDDAPSDESASSAQATRAPKQELRLNLDLQMTLQIEQRPVLMLDEEMEMNIDQRQELSVMFALQRRVERMSEEELIAYAGENPSRALNVFVFTLAGKLKRAKPELSWKAARQIARRAINDSQYSH